MRQLSFLKRVLLNYGTDKRCPFCDSQKTQLTSRKHLVLQLRQCTDCGLRFRWPKQTPEFSENYYQRNYKQGTFTTELPDKDTLDKYIASGFIGSPGDHSSTIDVLKGLLPKGRVLDYGCSWGYVTYQLKRAGYEAVGFEISKPRAGEGRKALGVEIVDSLQKLDAMPSASFDGIYSSHVLEHLLSLKEVFAFFARVLKPHGIAMVMVPNCGGKLARELGVAWGPMINEKHTLALDADFFQKNMPQFGFHVLTLSDPYEPSQVKNALGKPGFLPAEGQELMVVAQRKSG
jgi:2-polyprenyl-3-methyl-5-hydroxy-6-metoxy-1,4-benzoquinol methylase